MWIDLDKAGVLTQRVLAQRPTRPVRGQVLSPRGTETVNPMLAMHGDGPEEARCGSCQHFLRLSRGNKTVRKCERRSLSYSEATDHRAGWYACGLYEEARDDEQSGS